MTAADVRISFETVQPLLSNAQGSRIDRDAELGITQSTAPIRVCDDHAVNLLSILLQVGNLGQPQRGYFRSNLIAPVPPRISQSKVGCPSQRNRAQRCAYFTVRNFEATRHLLHGLAPGVRLGNL